MIRQASVKPLPGQRALFEGLPVPCRRCGRLLRAELSIARGIGRACQRIDGLDRQSDGVARLADDASPPMPKEVFQ